MAKKKIINKATKRLQKILTSNVKESEADTESLVVGVTRFLDKNIQKIIKGLKVDDLSAKERARALSTLEESLKDAGLDDELAAINDLFGAELVRVKELFKEATDKKALLTRIGKEDLDALSSFTFSESTKLVSNYVDDIRTEIIQGALGDAPTDILDIIEGATDKLAASLKTEWNTSLSGYARLATQRSAEEGGFQQFIYLGPLDDVTRPFCEPRVNQIYTIDEINEMDNGQLNPVSVYGGGYNCRHQWLPWDEALNGGEDNEE